MKKIKEISLLFILMIAFTLCLTFSVSAKNNIVTGTYGENVTYEFNMKTGQIVFSGTGDMFHYGYSVDFDTMYDYNDDVDIDYEYAGKTLFQSLGIKSVIISEGITDIGDYAFYNCESLKSVTIPKSVRKIGFAAFKNCVKLTSIYIPDSVTEIGGYAFYNCQSLKTVRLPKNITYIPSYAFAHCDSMNEITLPVNVKKIGDNAFYSCGVDNVNILGSDVVIGKEAFMHSRLKSLNVSEGVSVIGCKAFANCVGLENIIISESVVEVEVYAFYNCKNLKSVYIGSNVSSLNRKAFEQCDALEKIEVSADNGYYSSDEDGVLFNKDKTVLITSPNAFNKTNYTIPDSVEIITAEAFFGRKSIQSFSIGDNVVSIGVNAFSATGYYNNPDNWEDNALYIGKYLIGVDKSVTGEYTVKDGTLAIGGYAFNLNRKITKINLPEGLRGISDNAFGRLEITKIDIPDSVVHIGSKAFIQCSTLSEVKLPKNIKMIEDDTFRYCCALTKITIPQGVTNISGFSYCSSLTEINIPESVTKIAPRAFEHCYNLKKITVDEDNPVYTTDEYGVLFNKDKTTLVKYPSNLGFTKYIVPNSVTVISCNAFENVIDLKELILSENLRTIESKAIESCLWLTEITIPESVQEILSCGITDCTFLDKIIIKSPDAIIDNESLNALYYVVDPNLDSFNKDEALSKVKEELLETKCVFSKYWDACTMEAEDAVLSAVYCYKDSSAARFAVDNNMKLSYFEDETGHIHCYDDYKLIYPATLNSDGLKARVCNSCGEEIERQVIPKISLVYFFGFSANEDVVYDNACDNPTVIVRDAKGNRLNSYKSFDVQYSHDKSSVKSRNAKITFKGDYEGETKLKYTVVLNSPKDIYATQTASSVLLYWSSVHDSRITGYQVYMYNRQTKKYEKLGSTADREMKVTKLNSGTTYKFRVRAYYKDSRGCVYSNYVYITTCTKPAKTTLSVTSPSKGKVSFSWKNISGENGFEIYYSTKKNGEYKKLASYKANTVSGTKSKLKSGKTYYFKIRAYKTVGSTTAYGSFSSVKSIKVK